MLTKRREPPKRRKAFTEQFVVGGHSVFLTCGEFEDGSLAEIFLDVNKTGSSLRGMLNCFAIMVSLGLQSGIELEILVKFFSYMHFEPCGPVDTENELDISYAHSIIDLVFRTLAIRYLGDHKYLNNKTTEF